MIKDIIEIWRVGWGMNGGLGAAMIFGFGERIVTSRKVFGKRFETWGMVIKNTDMESWG